jgi:nitrite reductase/ring-hydroxylating ferredoxin subunit
MLAMLQIPYQRVVPYPVQVVLEQYFDFEHIAHVHPQTLGEYLLVEHSGRRLVYDQRWPSDRSGRRATSRVVQTYQPPGALQFDLVAGKHRGTKVHSELRPHPDGTEVVETYCVPGLPNWGLFRGLLAPYVYRQVERIWDEDLKVGICIGGWPGTPGLPAGPPTDERPRPLKPGIYRIGPVGQFPVASLAKVETPGGSLVLAHSTTGLQALQATCPHTGGPLGLGKLDGQCVVCPWHGARFDTTDGRAVNGPTDKPLPVLVVQMKNGELVVTV